MTAAVVQTPYISNERVSRKLIDGLGSFWTATYADADSVRSQQSANAALADQLYINFMEVLELRNRKRVPLYRRSRWFAVELSADARGTGDAYKPRVGEVDVDNAEPVFAGTPSPPPGISTYDVSGYALVNGFGAVIADSPRAASRIWTQGIDYDIVRQTLVFYEGRDPVQDSGTVTVWVADAGFDENWVRDYIGIGVGMRASVESTPHHHRTLNALWDLNTGASNPAGLRVFVAEALDLPVTKAVAEVVERVEAAGAGDGYVVTDAAAYVIRSGSVLAPEVVVGAVLESGTCLTEAVKFFLDPAAELSNPESDFAASAPMLRVPARMWAAGLRHGIGFTWDRVDIVYSGPDANGNPKLSFAVVSDTDDSEAMWARVWSEFESRSLDSRACFSPYLYDTLNMEPGTVWGSVVPAEFLLRHFWSANTAVIVVRSQELSVAGRRAMSMLARLHEVIPAQVRVVVIEALTTADVAHDFGECNDEDVMIMDAVLGSSRGINAVAHTPKQVWRPRCP